MNKTQLVDALAERLGDRRTAASAVDGLLETIVETVRGGDTVSITGFGVFESRARAARSARNPRTGEAVAVPAATVPAFRPGAGFRNAVGGGGGGGAAPASRRPPPRSAAVAGAPAAEASKAAPAKPARKAKSQQSFAAEPAPAKPKAARKAKAEAKPKAEPKPRAKKGKK